MPSTRPSVPLPLTLGQALDQSQALARLTERLRESQARFDAVSGCLPLGLRQHVRPGPVDETGWTLLAPSAAAAAKLRHLLPLAQERLSAAGWAPLELRVRVIHLG